MPKDRRALKVGDVVTSTGEDPGVWTILRIFRANRDYFRCADIERADGERRRVPIDILRRKP